MKAALWPLLANYRLDMVFVISFVFFVLFVGCMALGFMLRGTPLKSEEEAAAALEGLTCSACTLNCGFAGNKNHKPGKSCQADLKIAHKQV